MPNLYQGLILNNRYQLQTIIGKGGFSVVWLGHDQKENRLVAIKTSQDELSGVADTATRMEQEFHLTRSIQHPNLLLATDFFRYEDAACLVFEYKAKGTLHSKVKSQGSLNEVEIARLMSQISSALHELHANALIHFDVKPENILIDEKGDFFLADLDTASKLKNSMVRVSRIYADTPQYRSPEHLKGANELSDKVDIYALGITIFETCEGIIEKDYGIGMMMLTGTEKPSIQVPKYSMRLDQIIKSCWNFSPAERPTADALSAYARHFLNFGFWPEIVEFKPLDKPLSGGETAGSISNMRQTVGRPTKPNYIATPAIPDFPADTNLGSPGDNIKISEPATTSSSGSYSNIQDPGKPQTSPVLPPFGGMNPPPLTTDPPPPPSWAHQMRQTLSTINMKENPYVKWGALAIILLIVLVVSYCGTGRLRSDAQYNDFVQKAIDFRSEGKLKLASDAILEALKIKKKDGRATNIETEILHDADARHNDQMHFARMAIEGANVSDLEVAKSQMLENKDDASILIKGDSTEYYIQLIDSKLYEIGPKSESSNTDIQSPPSNPNSGDNNHSTVISPKDPNLEKYRKEIQQEKEWNADKASNNRNRISKWVNHPVYGPEAKDRLSKIGGSGNGQETPVKPPSPDPTPVPGPMIFKFQGYMGARDAKSGCKFYNIQKASILIKPDKLCKLENAAVYSSGCGKLRITLSGNGKSISETKELSDGKCDFEFDRIDAVVLEKNTVYTLSLETSTSDNCPGDPAPQLLNAADCGSQTSFREGVQVDYQGRVVLFSLKYRY